MLTRDPGRAAAAQPLHNPVILKRTAMSLVDELDKLDVDYEDGQAAAYADGHRLSDDDLLERGIEQLDLMDDFPHGSAWFYAIGTDGDEAQFYPGQGWE